VRLDGIIAGDFGGELYRRFHGVCRLAIQNPLMIIKKASRRDSVALTRVLALRFLPVDLFPAIYFPSWMFDVFK